MDLANLSSNWKKLQSNIAVANHKSTGSATLKRKHPTPRITTEHALKRQKKLPSTVNVPRLKTYRSGSRMDTSIEEVNINRTQVNQGRASDVEIGKYVALDCEMVGVGLNGIDSALARASVVNYNGEQVYDSFVKPKEEVTDWRTPISGIKQSHMNHARTFEEVQSDVAEILKDRIVVGHALRHDFKALLLNHPVRDIRDTSHFSAYKKLSGGTPKLQLLASELLGLEIQSGEHSSLEDARACMLLFRRDKDAFESKSKVRKRHK